jgi:sugar O-acyltransferase (sialic acid O-acetyltransferase NeuD family)
MKQLWIVGGAGAALEAWTVHAALESQGQVPPLAGFVTLDSGTEFDPLGRSVTLERDFLRLMDPSSNQVVLAIGTPSSRARAAQLYAARGFSFCTLIHPRAIIGPRVDLGVGSIVMAGTILETDLVVGPHAMINVQVSIAHECRIGSTCSIGPGVHLAGRVTLGDRCDLGVGAVIRPGINLGSDVVVGAGAVVVKHFLTTGTLLGVPARPRQ